MSFSAEIKKELSELNNLSNKQEVKNELLGYLLSDNISKDGKNIKYLTENEYNINRFAKLLKNVDINNYSINMQGKIYVITIKEKELKEILDIDFNELEDKRSVIRGMYLGAGSINNPENTYHLEMQLKNEKLVDEVASVLNKCNIVVKKMKKLIYIKDSEEISKFLAFIGASKSVLKFEEIRVQRAMSNKVNRIVNCETANLNKLLNASVEQIESIKKLKENGMYQKLNNELKEIAELRLQHPDYSLEKLGELLKKPIGKSGVNYRLRKIIELAKECD